MKHFVKLVKELFFPFQVVQLFVRMGCVNGKPVLSDNDLDFIANHTAVTRDEVDRQYENFLTEHPNGRITKKDFRHMMQVKLTFLETSICTVKCFLRFCIVVKTSANNVILQIFDIFTHELSLFFNPIDFIKV